MYLPDFCDNIDDKKIRASRILMNEDDIALLDLSQSPSL